MKLEICTVKFTDLKLTPRYAEKLRGYIGNKYKEIDLLHNHNQNKLIYRYPLVQYKIINSKPIIMGINDGINIVSKIGLKDDELILDGINYETFQKEINKSNFNFGCTEDYLEYEFKTAWIALNQKNISQYNKGSKIQKEEILKKILIGNLIAISKGLKYNVTEEIHAWIDLKEKDVNFKGIKHTAFIGKFKVNFNIPDYLGIGKSVSRGFGTIKKI
ncbi:CRISPR-associated endonuclease Cas6 [Clostridium tarantellae]|uniref:DNA repair protein n=1 Tax=Clostridium tarantellae TaxID=39493 RepID=A0A6I1MJT2_9CLOT|nr:CRISPR-associated endonuclease Cas6 [Clostridium tarantellae]MPQ43645.1 DNA repair protein [Clostridium tarantellae]